MRLVAFAVPFAVPFVLASCAALPPEVADDAAADDDAEELAQECAFDDDVVFDPHGGLVLQAANDVACVRIERAPLADVRRGVEWRAVHVAVVVDGAAIEDASASYENSHHNCRDVVSARDGVTVAIDGVSDNPDVCFQDEASAWRLLLTIPSENGPRTETLLPIAR